VPSLSGMASVDRSRGEEECIQDFGGKTIRKEITRRT
jgi:hypothetical protein